MSKCLNCRIKINDPGQICPLCGCTTERAERGGEEFIYPCFHAEKEIKKMQIALNIYLSSAIAAEALLCVADLWMGGSVGWLILVEVFLAYGYLTLKVSIQMHTGYRLKVFMQSVLGVAVLLAIDVVSGFRGWSLAYVIPAACIMIDMGVIVLMIVNRRDWQSHIPSELMLTAFSILPFVLYGFGFVHHLTVPAVALCVTSLTFVGTLLIGGRRARDELYRRFHI